jgi:hypothetical protein
VAAAVKPLVPSATTSRFVSASTDVRNASRSAHTSPDDSVELPVAEDSAAGAVVAVVPVDPAVANGVTGVVAEDDAESSSSPHDTIKTPSTTHATIARTSGGLSLGFIEVPPSLGAFV